MRTMNENEGKKDIHELNLWLIRHAATLGNRRHAYIGITDEPISEEGKVKLDEYKKQGCYPNVKQIFCSPMLRCRQSARLIFPEIEPVIIEQWREINFGVFENKSYTELNGNADYQRWIDSMGTMKFPQGEGRAEFVSRTMEGLKLWAKNVNVEEPSSAAVVHGGTIMAIASTLTGKDYYDFQIKNGECIKLKLGVSDNNVHLIAIDRLM